MALCGDSLKKGAEMGIMRKGLFLASGGMSGVAGVKANSKKERIAKALEKQNREARRQMARPAAKGIRAGFENQVQKSLPAPAPKVEPKLSTVELVEGLAKAGGLHQQGLITDEEFATIKDRLMNEATLTAAPSTRSQHLAQLHTMLSELRDAKERSSDKTFTSASGPDESEPDPAMISEAEFAQPRQPTSRQVPTTPVAAPVPSRARPKPMSRSEKQALSDRLLLARIERGERGLLIPPQTRKRLAVLRQARVEATAAEEPRPRSEGASASDRTPPPPPPQSLPPPPNRAGISRKQAEGDRRLLDANDRGWRSGTVVTPKGKKRAAALREAKEVATPLLKVLITGPRPKE
jgi:hypothetical protein